MMRLKLWTAGLAVTGCLIGACNDASEGGLEPGTYLLTPENRDFRFELADDGTFSTYGLEWDLNQLSSGVWSHQDGETVLRPEDDDPSKDSVDDERCPMRCFGWSTTEGFTSVTEVRLVPTDDPSVIEATFYDRVEEQDVLQRFTLADPDAALPGI